MVARSRLGPMDDTGQDLLDRVRAAQLELGTGAAEDALGLAEPLLEVTRQAMGAPSFLGRSSADRRALLEAFCFARVTAVLALESVGASRAVPRIRALAAEAREIAAGAPDGWRVQSAAAEMLSRCGDGQGALAAVRAASRSAPEERYVIELESSIRSMFPTLAGDAGTGATPA